MLSTAACEYADSVASVDVGRGERGEREANGTDASDVTTRMVARSRCHPPRVKFFSANSIFSVCGLRHFLVMRLYTVPGHRFDCHIVFIRYIKDSLNGTRHVKLRVRMGSEQVNTFHLYDPDGV